MAYRLCEAGVSLRAEINKRWPNRDKKSDGWIGDAAHASRTSDHNPWIKKAGVGIVRAIDVDIDGVNMAWIMEHLRKLGEARDPRLYPNGYLIFNSRITDPSFKSWRAYNGSNPHTQHGHVSFTTNPDGFDLVRPWGVLLPGTEPLPPSPSQEESMANVPQQEWDRLYRQETTPLEYSTHHGATKDDQFGQILSIRKEVVALRSEVASLRAMLSALPIALRNAMEGKQP